MLLDRKVQLAIGISLTLLTPLAMAKKAPKLNFTKQQIDIGSSVTGEMLYLNNSNAAMNVLIQQNHSFVLLENIGENALEENVKKIAIPESVILYSKGKLATTSDEVLFYLTADSVVAHDVKSGSNEVLFKSDHLYRGQVSIKPKKADFVVDINQDGLSDIITSAYTHTNVYIQNQAGEFDHTQLELAPHSRITNDGVQFSEHKAHIFDVNNDGKTDLAFQIDNELLVFKQNEKHGFDAHAQKISLNAGLLTPKQEDSKDQERRIEGQKAKERMSFEHLKDLNNDGLVDLVTKSSVREGMTSSNSEYQVRYGALKNELLSFSKAVDTVIKLKGGGKVTFTDINNDGKQDLYALSVEFGMGAVMSLMSGNIDMDLEIYPMQSNSQFDEEPSYKNEVEVEVSMGEDSDTQPILALEDFNGDGIKDLILKSDDDELNIIYGSTGKRLFAKRGVKYDTDITLSGQLDIKDFNLDGKADVLFRFALDEGKSQLVRWLSTP
jgi:hypothetical protein